MLTFYSAIYQFFYTIILKYDEYHMQIKGIFSVYMK